MPLMINDDGIYNSDTFSLSCSEALLLGTALGNIHDDILVGCNQKDMPVYHALTAGILSKGKNVWNCGECTQSQIRFALQTTKINCGIYIDHSFKNIKVIPFSKFGFTLSFNEENELLENMKTASDDDISEPKGKITDSSTLCDMYLSECRHIFKNLPQNTSVQINSGSRIIKNFFAPMFSECKPDFYKDIVFNVSSDGMKVSAYCDSSGFIFYEKLLLICCKNEFEKGNDIPLPHSFPMLADMIATDKNRYTYRFDPYSDSFEDTSRKSVTLDYPFLSDGISLIGKIFEIMNEKSKTLSELANELPHFTTTMKYINIKKDPDETIKKITDSSENNVCYTDNNGRILAKKSKSGKSLIFLAESYSSESAEEFCNNWLLKSNITT